MRGDRFADLAPAVVLASLLFFQPAPGRAAAGESLVWPDRVRIVYLPAEGRDATLARYAELTDYLTSMLGVPVEPISFAGYREMFAWMATNDFELAYLSPSTLCQAQAWAPLVPIAMEADSRGRTGYYSMIICRADRNFRSLQDLGEATFAFTDPESTTGFLVPLAHFLTAMGNSPGSLFGKVVFGGDHRAVIQGVRDGKYDAGAVSSTHLERILAETPDGVEVKELWRSELLPGLPVCARADLPAAFRDAVAALFLNYNADPGRARRLGIGGYAPAGVSNFAGTMRLEAYRP